MYTNKKIYKELISVKEHLVTVLDANNNLLESNGRILDCWQHTIDRNNDLIEFIRRNDRSSTSFQEDLEFFVNDCTKAQLKELQARIEEKLASLDDGQMEMFSEDAEAAHD